MFGPSALATPANAVTLSRLLASPFLFAAIIRSRPSEAVFFFWAALAMTDFFDGYIARRFGTTRSGTFLDPLADKVLVLGALAILVIDGVFWWLPVTLIALREFAISAYRAKAANQGLMVPARFWAKAKAWVQDIAVGFALLPQTADEKTFLSATLWLAVIFTVGSGLQYLFDSGKNNAV